MGEKSYEVGDEVVAVVDEFIAYFKLTDDGNDKESLNSLSFLSKALLVLTVLCGVAFLVVGNFTSIGNVVLQPEYRLFYLFFLLFTIFVAFSFVVVEYKLSANFFKNTELEFLKDSKITIRREAEFFDRLSKYSLVSLKHVQHRFNMINERGSSLIGLFVGFIGKTGIIPAVALIIVAILNVGDKTGFSTFEYIALSAVVIYVLMFRMMLVVIQCKSYSQQLDFYIENYRELEGENNQKGQTRLK